MKKILAFLKVACAALLAPPLATKPQPSSAECYALAQQVLESYPLSCRYQVHEVLMERAHLLVLLERQQPQGRAQAAGSFAGKEVHHG